MNRLLLFSDSALLSHASQAVWTALEVLALVLLAVTAVEKLLRMSTRSLIMWRPSSLNSKAFHGGVIVAAMMELFIAGSGLCVVSSRWWQGPLVCVLFAFLTGYGLLSIWNVGDCGCSGDMKSPEQSRALSVGQRLHPCYCSSSGSLRYHVLEDSLSAL